MTEEEIKMVAKQLRKPQGEFATEIGKKMNEGNLQINKYAIAELNTQPGETILEIGMGNGFFVKDIVSIDNSINYYGCDFSEDMINQASMLNEQFVKNGQVQFHLSNANKLPLENASINKVLTINTLYFWDDTTVVLNELKRVLKPAGEVVIAIRPKDAMETYPVTKYGFNTFSAKDLEDLLTKNGFTLQNTLEVEEKEMEFLDGTMKDEFVIVRASV